MALSAEIYFVVFVIWSCNRKTRHLFLQGLTYSLPLSSFSVGFFSFFRTKCCFLWKLKGLSRFQETYMFYHLHHSISRYYLKMLKCDVGSERYFSECQLGLWKWKIWMVRSEFHSLVTVVLTTCFLNNLKLKHGVTPLSHSDQITDGIMFKTVFCSQTSTLNRVISWFCFSRNFRYKMTQIW